MRPLIRRIRFLALLQLLLALPPLASGSVCIPLDGSGRPEAGFCVCTIESVAGAETAIQPSGTAECGPCRDVTFSSVRTARAAAPDAPAMTLLGALPSMARTIRPIAGAAMVRFSTSPLGRHPILRC